MYAYVGPLILIVTVVIVYDFLNQSFVLLLHTLAVLFTVVLMYSVHSKEIILYQARQKGKITVA